LTRKVGQKVLFKVGHALAKGHQTGRQHVVEKVQGILVLTASHVVHVVLESHSDAAPRIVHRLCDATEIVLAEALKQGL
jgi:hypothetical protein